ncbi:MAG TPA: NlpC/P60 family protein [Nocardioidaceae bacterium]|nr:NlpC/P60 family protein [Nocardioidaceae bacterium]
MSPGDLVFYYSPISHVGIYLGGGMLIHAPHPGSSVEIVDVNSMPITTVRRVS